MSAAPTAERRTARAQARWVRMSPRKARLVVDHIRGRSVAEARTILAFTERAAARQVERVLRSAVANAEANHRLASEALVISAAFVDEGPVLKRWRARARGRVARIRKPTCHITIEVTEDPRVQAPRRRPAAPAKTTEASPDAGVAEKPKRAPRRRSKEGAPA